MGAAGRRARSAATEFTSRAALEQMGLRFFTTAVVCAGNFLRHQGIVPQCTCACCVAALPRAVDAARPVHCATPPEVSGRRCVDYCSVLKDSILAAAHQNEYQQALVDYDRFCFFECAPPAGVKVDPGSLETCRALPAPNVASASTIDGNGQEVIR